VSWGRLRVALLGAAVLGGACRSGDAGRSAAPPVARSGAVATTTTASPAAPPAATRPLVGAFYHLWNPENLDQGYLRARLRPPQTSMADHAAGGVTAAEADIDAAAGHGIDFFALDWWPSRPEQNRRIDERFLAAANASRIRFCIFYETQDLEADLDHSITRLDGGARRRLVDDLDAIGQRYFSHPGYLRVGGRPVVILYLSRGLTGDVAGAVTEVRQRLRARGEDLLLIGDELFWRVSPLRGRNVVATKEPQPERALLFDGLTAYNLYDGDTPGHTGYGATSTFLADVAGLYERWRVALDGRVPIVPSVIPGYNDRGLAARTRHRPIPRQWEPGAAEGSFLARFLDDVALPAVDPRLPLVLVTSWNEWNEDTAVEPIAPAPPTAVDDSPSGRDLTSGAGYAGFGAAYLDVIAARFPD
jgi:hypothetical protein